MGVNGSVMKGLEQYPVKVLLALVQSVKGRVDFFKLLHELGYPQLAAFSNAIRGDDDAMVWLFKNGYAWLAILSNACDGEERAIDWVRRGMTEVNLRFALACRHDVGSLRWLYARRLGVLLMLVREVERFLEYQQKEHDWPYVMHFGGHVRAAAALEEWQQQKNHDKESEQRQPEGQ
ncbi:MAG: hypothetical protein IJU19_03265 [Bacteroidales bacterium]|nr:hypothetical protein [Bacteroidales bacterium]